MHQPINVFHSKAVCPSSWQLPTDF
uniref:Uncharacterized protein n=1 Tax=Anguilla anguilla TaxID=7936 RepID=A0A0E9V7I1_ANGAN